MKFDGKIFITGGAGTLGKAFIAKAVEEEWDCEITVFSRDPEKHRLLRQKYPGVNTIAGDILDADFLEACIAGHDIVIHAAAMKHVVDAEKSPGYTIQTNISGSDNVLRACVNQNVKHVIGISTDKACWPSNSYGASKMLMERLFCQYANFYTDVLNTQFHLVRYGNVFGSTGSFVHNWVNDLEEFGYVHSTVPTMTRFWLNIDEALKLIWLCMKEPSGCTLIPLPKAALIGDIEEWLLPEGTEIKYIGYRAGEKEHECLLTKDEGRRAQTFRYSEDGEDDYFYIRLHPPGSEEGEGMFERTSDQGALRMAKEEFLEISGEKPIENEKKEHDANDHS